jgi:cytochrome oxidase Cu insertion factor (SCO1/SenC/PrrC family)
MKEIHENIGDQVVILTISIDPQSDSLQDIEKWKNDFKATWTFGLDQDKKLFNQFNLTNLPGLLLFNEEGNLVKQWQGITQPSVIYSELNRQFGIPIPDVQDNGNSLLVDQLLANTGFRITVGLSLLAISLIIISNIVNRGTASDPKNLKNDSV